MGWCLGGGVKLLPQVLLEQLRSHGALIRLPAGPARPRKPASQRLRLGEAEIKHSLKMEPAGLQPAGLSSQTSGPWTSIYSLQSSRGVAFGGCWRFVWLALLPRVLHDRLVAEQQVGNQKILTLQTRLLVL